MLGNSLTHIIECTGSGTLSLENFTFTFFPIKDENINMIRFDCSGTFYFSNCIVKGGGAALSSSTFIIVSNSLLNISHCDYLDIEVYGSDAGAAIHCEIAAGKEFVVEYCTFTRCKQTKDGMGSQGGAIMAYGSDPSHYENAGAGTLVVKECIFTSCSSVNDGGCICVRGPAAKFEDCRFVDGWGGHWGGAITFIFRYSYNLTRCVFLNCRAMNNTDIAGNGGGVNIWDELYYVNPSFKFDHCYFEGNNASRNGTDISLTLKAEHFTSIESWFIHSLSRTRRSGNVPQLVYKYGNVIYNNLVPYSHGLILYAGTTHKDVEYCGCIDYRCRTLEYTCSR
jgi:hypothetical protein